MLSDELIDIINESLIVLPRKYLFTKKNGDNFSSSASLSVSLLNLLKEFMNDKHFSFNTFRHAYAEWSLKQDVKTDDNILKSSLKNNENKEVKNVSFSDELRNRKKELKENIKETIETKQQTNKILSFLHNNIQTIIFAIFMVILCILFHIYHRNNIKTE